MSEPDHANADRVLPSRRGLASRARRPKPYALFALFALFGLSVESPASSDTGGTLSAAPIRSTDGVYQLGWTHAGRVRIEESARPDFGDAVIIYEGADRATTLSGRTDGFYYYRLVPLDGSAASAADGALRVEPIRVEVVHHPLSRALAFFVLGLVVFTSTVLLVVMGDRSASAPTEPRNG